MRTILIGQAPSKHGNPATPLAGKIARDLARLCGMSKEAYFYTFERRNLLNRWPGKSGKGNAFPMREARKAAEKMAPSLASCRVIFMGQKVAAAFGMTFFWYLEWFRMGSFTAAIFPHPSGVNRWWNDEANERRAARFLERAAKASG